MFNKTSSIEFLKYGEVFSQQYFSTNKLERDQGNNYLLTVQNNSITYFYEATEDIYLKTVDGICMLIVTEDPDSLNYEEFVIHRIVKINKGVYFNFVSLGKEAKLEMAFPPYTIIQNRFFKGAYTYKRIEPSIRINELVAYYYNIRSSNYIFPGEKDNYWELTFVDYGTLHTTIDEVKYTLSCNQLIIYAPDQSHRQNTKEEACSYLTIILDMDIAQRYKEKLINQVFDIDRDSRTALEAFVRSNDSGHAYEGDMMIVSIEKVIINLLRSTSSSKKKISSTPMQQKFENELLNEILLFINENVYTSFNVAELCDVFAISRSSLQSLFRNNLNTTPKEYISNLKLEKSKLLIKESKYTVSEIAAILGFSSIHYFSRRFKQEFGVSPTEYANKII